MRFPHTLQTADAADSIVRPRWLLSVPSKSLVFLSPLRNECEGRTRMPRYRTVLSDETVEIERDFPHSESPLPLAT